MPYALRSARSTSITRNGSLVALLNENSSSELMSCTVSKGLPAMGAHDIQCMRGVLHVPRSTSRPYTGSPCDASATLGR